MLNFSGVVCANNFESLKADSQIPAVSLETIRQQKTETPFNDFQPEIISDNETAEPADYPVLYARLYVASINLRFAGDIMDADLAGVLTPALFVKLFNREVDYFKDVHEPAPSREAYETILHVSERMSWIFEEAAVMSNNDLSKFEQLVTDPYARIMDSVANSNTLSLMRSDADIIANQFLNNAEIPAETVAPDSDKIVSPKIYITPVTANFKDKKINYCWFKELKGNTCVYKCKNGVMYEMPAQRPSPWDEFVIPCPQLVFPF